MSIFVRMSEPTIFRSGLGFNPPHFSGAPADEAKLFWKKFIRYCDVTGVKENDRSTIFGLLVSGSVELWYNSLPAQTINNFATFENAFKAHYVNAPAEEFKRKVNMLKCKQDETESVDSYFTNTLSQFDGQNLPLDLQLTLLVDGLRSSIRAVVLQHGPFETVSSLLDRCRRVEASLSHDADTTQSIIASAVSNAKSRVNEAVESLKNELQGIKEKIKEMTSQLKKSPLPRERKRVYYANHRKTCYNCGSLHHLARNCTVYRTGFRQRHQNTQQSPKYSKNNSPPLLQPVYHKNREN